MLQDGKKTMDTSVTPIKYSKKEKHSKLGRDFSDFRSPQVNASQKEETMDTSMTPNYVFRA